MTDEQDRWMDVSRFRGETISAMKAINKELKEIKEEQQCLRRDFRRNRENIFSMKVKLAGIAGTISLLTTIVVLLISNSIS